MPGRKNSGRSFHRKRFTSKELPPHQHIQTIAAASPDISPPTSPQSRAFTTNASLQDEIDVSLAIQRSMSTQKVHDPSTPNKSDSPITFAQATRGLGRGSDISKDMSPNTIKQVETMGSVVAVKFKKTKRGARARWDENKASLEMGVDKNVTAGPGASAPSAFAHSSSQPNLALTTFTPTTSSSGARNPPFTHENNERDSYIEDPTVCGSDRGSTVKDAGDKAGPRSFALSVRSSSTSRSIRGGHSAIPESRRQQPDPNTPKKPDRTKARQSSFRGRDILARLEARRDLEDDHSVPGRPRRGIQRFGGEEEALHPYWSSSNLPGAPLFAAILQPNALLVPAIFPANQPSETGLNPEGFFLVSADTVINTSSDANLNPLEEADPLAFDPDDNPDDEPVPEIAIGNLDPIEDDHSDTESVKIRAEAVLAQLRHEEVEMGPSYGTKLGQDAFDSVDWDPDMPSMSSPDKSPEPVAIKPQTLTYTTVGSVVDPKAAPQFSAPNRIQREGANRRPLMAMIENNQFGLGDLFTTRGPVPPLSMSNSMQYAQQLRNQGGQGRSTPLSSTGSTLSPEQAAWLKENDSKAAYYGANPPNPNTTFSETLLQTLLDSKATQIPEGFDIDNYKMQLTVQEMMGEVKQGKFPSQGLEKMQTLQRLAKFHNPAQGAALSRLSQFAVGKGTTTSKPLTNADGLTPYEMMARNAQASSSRDRSGRGELDRDFQFPPPGLPISANPQANPLFGASNLASTQPAQPLSRPPGYPQPLTAGPPGQRQWPTANSAYAPMHSQVDAGYIQQPAVNYGSYPITNTDSPWASPYDPSSGSHLQVCQSEIFNTISSAEAQKYYPWGFPPGMSEEYKPSLLREPIFSGVKSIRKFTDEDQEQKLQEEEEKRAARAKAHEDWFYEGFYENLKPYDQKKKERDERNAAYRANPHGPIGPPKKTAQSFLPKQITVEEMNKMSIAEATKPLLVSALSRLEDFHEKENPRYLQERAKMAAAASNFGATYQHA